MYNHITPQKERVSNTYFGIFLIFILSGYALLGRGFAYLGIPPIFIGEVGLAFAVATILYRFHSGLLRSPVAWLLIVFMLWGAICTFPHVAEHGLDAFRDGVVWGYAFYAFAVATVLVRFGALAKVSEIFGRAVPAFLLLAPIVLVAFWSLEGVIPRWPWGPPGGVSVVHVKAGDLAVHYAGILAFLVLGLSPALLKTRWVVLWLLGATPVMFLSRGAFVTIACVLLLIALLRPTIHYGMLFAFGVAGLSFLYLTGVEINPGTATGRVISVEQLIQNINSIVFPADRTDQALQGTRIWRELWWDKIINYTFSGDFFWTGRGFGVNLADMDGFQTADGTLRSPHNIHLTILARSGVPGLFIWMALNITFGFTLIMNMLQDRRAKRVWLAHMELWTVLYWLAFLINGTFDVFLEGPQGGVWFWSVFGVGLALIVVRQHAAAASRGDQATRKTARL